MVMPLCGTCHYAGIVPVAARRTFGLWRLDDQSGARRLPTIVLSGFGNALVDNRLVGLKPSARIKGASLILKARGWMRATVSSFTIDLDSELLESVRPGDHLEVVRTGTADVAVAVLRDGALRWAVGAVTTVRLGAGLEISSGPPPDMHRQDWLPTETWLDVTAHGSAVRMRDGEESLLGAYRVTVARTYKYGIPGRYESVAVSAGDERIHDAAVRAAASMRCQLSPR